MIAAQMRSAADTAECEQTERGRRIKPLTLGDEEWTRLSQAIVHDLRAPLHMATAFCDLMNKNHGESLDERARAYLSHSVDAVAQMNRLLEGLAEFSRPSLTGAEAVWFSADDALDRALEALRGRIHDTGAAVTREPLPHILGDPGRFQRLLQNLIDNALACAREGERPQVSLSAAEQGEVWRFSVSDKGVGIDPAHHERIFEPCKRLSRRPGAGLGLTICRKIVTELGGDIWAASNPDGGTCFNFTVNRANRSGADV